MDTAERNHLIRAFVSHCRTYYDPGHAVVVLAVWEWGEEIWTLSRNWFYEDAVRGTGFGVDRNPDLWMYELLEPGPRGRLDPVTGIEWSHLVGPIPDVPDDVLVAARDAAGTPWSPPASAAQLPWPAGPTRGLGLRHLPGAPSDA